MTAQKPPPLSERIIDEMPDDWIHLAADLGVPVLPFSSEICALEERAEAAEQRARNAATCQECVGGSKVRSAGRMIPCPSCDGTGISELGQLRAENIKQQDAIKELLEENDRLNKISYTSTIQR